MLGSKDNNEQNLAFGSLVGIKCILYDDAAVAVEGHKGLKFFSSEKIVFKATKGRNFFVKGKNLVIGRFSYGYALVVGVVAEVGYESIG